MRPRYSCVSVLVFLLVATHPAPAQDLGGIIEGTATDRSGAVLVGARVTAETAGNLAGRTTTTDAAGVFRLAVLPPGRYELTARLDGFAALVVRDVILDAGQRVRVDVRLEPAGVEQHVTVEAVAPGIDAR